MEFGSHFLIVVLIGGLLTCLGVAFAENGDLSFNTLQKGMYAIEVIANTEGRLQTVTIPISQLLFKLTAHYNNKGDLLNFDIDLKPESTDLYKELGPNRSLKPVFIYPIFTQAAYGKNGFYDYYNKKCDTSCLTVSIPKPAGYYSASGDGSVALHLLDYPFITDIDIDKNPDILKQYDRVIVLHNEYVTKKEFDAITSHPDVIFLYPNALYAEVKADYTSNTITLVRGHGYPEPSIKNGFDWKSDNSRYEYNVFCNDWAFYKKENYFMLNCYPEYRLLHSSEMLRLLQTSDPTLLLEDTSNWLRYQNDTRYSHQVLLDFDINGTFIPPWVVNPTLWAINGEITKSELFEILNYLYEKNIIQ